MLSVHEENFADKGKVDVAENQLYAFSTVLEPLKWTNLSLAWWCQGLVSTVSAGIRARCQPINQYNQPGYQHSTDETEASLMIDFSLCDLK